MSRRGELPHGPLDAAGGPREGKGLAPPEAFSPLRGAGPWLGTGCLLRVKAPTSQRSFEHLPFCKVLFKALWGGGVRVVRGRRTSSRESQRRQTRCEPAGGRVSWGPTGASGPEAAGPPREAVAAGGLQRRLGGRMGQCGTGGAQLLSHLILDLAYLSAARPDLWTDM